MSSLFNTVDQTNKVKSKLTDIEKSSRRLFEDLCDGYFDSEEYVVKLREYLKKTPRVYYSVFSKMIYNLDEDKLGNLDTNIELLIDFTDTTRFEELFERGTSNYGDKKLVVKVIHKLWDHSRLAENQITEIKKDNFLENFQKEKIKIEEDIKNEGQKLNKDLITLVGIFTAMAFLVFGGLNSLSAVFENAVNNVPVLNLSVICLLWGICVYNMIYLFMFLISKLTGNDISTNKESTNIFRRHIIYFTGNIVLISALCVSGWLYLIKINFRGWYSKLYHVWKAIPMLSWSSPAIVIPAAFIFVVTLVIVILLKTKDEKKSGSNLEEINSNQENELEIS